MRFSVLNFINIKQSSSSKKKKNICIEEKVIIWINFNPGLALAGFQTILPGFKQVNQTWARDPMKNHHLVSGQLWKNTWPRWVVDLSPRYGHMILVSRYLILTGVSWSQHGCPISKKYTVNQGCMSLSIYYWVWPPCCATPPPSPSSSSSSCVRAHEQYR